MTHAYFPGDPSPCQGCCGSCGAHLEDDEGFHDEYTIRHTVCWARYGPYAVIVPLTPSPADYVPLAGG